MNEIVINIAKTYQDAVIIGNMLAKLWNDKIEKSDYDLIFRYINLFPKGHLIALRNSEPIASSIAFTISIKPSINEFSSKHPYDFFSDNGKFYYIHVIQVLPEFRNIGIGTKILNRQIIAAREKGCDYVTGFSVDKELYRWEKKGFISIGEFGEYKNFGRVKWIEMRL